MSGESDSVGDMSEAIGDTKKPSSVTEDSENEGLVPSSIKCGGGEGEEPTDEELAAMAGTKG